MPIVADTYRFVVGVDTHAATHSYAIITCPTGVVIDQQKFPTTVAGLGRARAWVARRTHADIDGVLVAAEGTGSYGALLAALLDQAGYRVVEAPTPRRGRGRAKTDQLDALAAARSTLVVDVDRLRDRRAGQVQSGLQILLTAREHANTDKVRCINALTALVRTHPLGVDARTALSLAQIKTIAVWRARDEPFAVVIARTEAIRHAKRVLDLDAQLKTNREQITCIVQANAPHLTTMTGVGAITAAVILTVWSHPGRIRSEAALAQIAGTCPIPASSGNTTRHRLNRGGDRRLNRAINTIVLTRMRADPATRTYIERRRTQGKTDREIRRCLKRYITRQIYRTLTTGTRPAAALPAAA